MTDKRGLVIFCPMVEGGGSSELDPQDLRAALLFFDELCWPTSNTITIDGNDPVYNYLLSEGVLTRQRVLYREGTFSLAHFAEQMIDVFRHKEKQEEGGWALNGGANSVPLPASFENEARGIVVKLIQAVPIPNKDVAIQDILEFRERRKPELLEMRTAIEEMGQVVAGAADQPLAWRTQVEKMTRAINQQVDASRGMLSSWRWGSLDLTTSLSGTVIAAVAGAMQGGWSMAMQMAAGAAIPQVSMSVTKSISRASPHPWKYVASIHNDLMIGD